MKIAALQMVSTPRVDDNLAAAAQLIGEAAGAGARVVVLPEYFCHMGHDDRDKLRIAEADGSGPIQHMLSTAAQRHGVWLIGGTLPLRTDDPDRAYNACCAYAPDGSRAARYDKMHLFCYDNGRERYDEARVLRAGSLPVAFNAAVADHREHRDSHGQHGQHDPQEPQEPQEPQAPQELQDRAAATATADPNAAAAAPATNALRVGLSICYDLRFPELYRALMAQALPCDLIAVPAAFTYTTGQAHWELLLRARAVENQCYVIAAAQGGRHENGRSTWGHSMVVDPWGNVLAVLPEGAGVVLAELDLRRLAAVRLQLPALTHRRL